MDPTMIEVAKQVPALAVLAGVVFLFLKTVERLIGNHDATLKELQNNYIVSIREIQEANVAARHESRDAIRENTVATREMNKTLVDLLLVVKSK